MENIENMFANYGQIVKRGFYNSFVLWKRENTIKPVEVPSSKFHKYHDKKHLINIEAILKDDMTGQKVIKFYTDHNMLDDIHRTMIISVLVNYLFQKVIWVKRHEFVDLTAKILRYFKNVDPESERVRIVINYVQAFKTNFQKYCISFF